nr:replication initiator protein A [Bradyrhizobium tropiciagri]
MPERGTAIVWDADVLTSAASQIVEARGLQGLPLMTATPHESVWRSLATAQVRETMMVEE